MIYVLRTHSRKTLEELNKVLLKQGYALSSPVLQLESVTRVYINTEALRVFSAGAEVPNSVVYPHQIAELALMPTLESFHIMLAELFGHPSDA